MIENLENAMAAIKKLRMERDMYYKRYFELIYAVEKKHPGESRSATALRLIKEGQHLNSGAAKNNEGE